MRHPGNRNAHDFHDTRRPVPNAESGPSGFLVLSKRWVVERTHAWNERWRRLVSHHDCYRRRNVIERCVGWLREARAVATRYEKLAVHYLGILKLAIIRRHLRLALANRT